MQPVICPDGRLGNVVQSGDWIWVGAKPMMIFFISRLLSQEPDLVWSETFQAYHGNCIENVGQGFSRRIFEAWCTDSRVPRVA